MKKIYFMKNEKNTIIYIGKTKNLNQRLHSHKIEKKKDDWYSEVKTIEYISYNNNYLADIMEIYYIGKYKPIYNIEHMYNEEVEIDLKKYEKPTKKINQEDTIIELEDIDTMDKNHFKKFKIYEGKLNDIGKMPNSLSDNWFRENKNIIYMRKNIYTYFKTRNRTKSKENAWTCTEWLFNSLKGDGYTRRWKSLYIKNNEHNTKAIAFISNIFIYNKSIDEDENSYALKVLLNFLYKFKNEEDMYLYIPSKRMRDMLIKWLER